MKVPSRAHGDHRRRPPLSDVLAGDRRVTEHLGPAAIDKLLDPVAYTGLCAEMAREAAPPCAHCHRQHRLTAGLLAGGSLRAKGCRLRAA
jgi:hypothetical protein